MLLSVVLVVVVVVVGFGLYARYWYKRPSIPRGYVGLFCLFSLYLFFFFFFFILGRGHLICKWS